MVHPSTIFRTYFKEICSAFHRAGKARSVKLNAERMKEERRIGPVTWTRDELHER